MNALFLCGVFAAWAVAQVALGMFFALAYAVRRREVEYLLFGLTCFALALNTAGISYGYFVIDVTDWRVATAVAHCGAIPAVALNLHFVLRYIGASAPWRVMAPVYAITSVFAFGNVLGFWWVPASLTVKRVELFGSHVDNVTATPSPIAVAFYAFAFVLVAVSLVWLERARRGGNREASIALGASAIIALTVLNDVALVTGNAETVYMTPHGFMAYAFAVGSTLILRYRSTAGDLEAAVVDLRERTDELRSSYAELRVVQNELSKKKQLAAVGELAAMIAHEVRNPIAVIMNAVASLRRPGTNPDDRGMLLGIVEEEASRLNRLVTDLLRFARPVNVKRGPVSLPELARRAASVVDSEHALEVEIEDEASIETISADASLLRLVIENLISNACQSMPSGGKVRVQVRRDDLDGEPGVSIMIVDAGEGMDGAVLARARDPFFTTRPSGTGLGLPIVERILEAHGGSVVIESAAGVGTTVRLFLPANAGVDPVAESEADEESPPERRTA